MSTADQDRRAAEEIDCEKPGDCAYPGCDYSEDDDPFDEDCAELECEHEEYDLDILTGRATCARCNHRWFMSEAELKRDQEMRQMPYPGEEPSPPESEG